MFSVLQGSAPALWGYVRLGMHGVYVGLVVGFVVGLFRVLEAGAGQALHALLGQWREHLWIIALCFGAMLPVAWCLGRLVRAVPESSGSGIPQVELCLHEGIPLHWSRLLWTKFVGAWLAIAAGLSLGREGPCIHMGAAIGAGVNALWGRLSLRQNPYIIAGAAAGLGAAFGAPLAACIFVYEEMRCQWNGRIVLVLVVAVSVAQAYIVHVYGLGRILPFTQLQAPPAALYGLLSGFGLLLGLAGMLYTRCLISMKDAEARQKIVPQLFRMLPALICAALCMFVAPRLLGGGDALILESATLHSSSAQATILLLCLLCVLKYAFSLYSYMGGVPGGLLMPLLCVGALLGAACGHALVYIQWIAPEQMQSFILLGMAGYFAAIVRAPLTGICLILEMTGAWEFLPACLVVSYVACAVANAGNTAPVYDLLKIRVRQSMTAQTGKAVPASSTGSLLLTRK